MESAEDELIAETEKVMSSLLELPSPMKKSSKRKRRGRNSDTSGLLDQLEDEVSSGASSGASTGIVTPHDSMFDLTHGPLISSELQARRNSLQIKDNALESISLTKHIMNRRMSLLG